MRKLINVVVLVSTCVFGLTVHAEPKKIDVNNSPDTELLSRMMFEVSLNHLFPCVQAKGGQPTDATMQACFCETKAEIEKKIKIMDGVLDKHPDWRGNIIHFTDSEKTELWLEVFNVDLFKANIAMCK